MAAQGMATKYDLLGRMPDVPPCLLDIYQGFLEIDRDGMSGAITTAGMNVVLDEMGIAEPVERREIRRLWREMEHARRTRDEEIKGTGVGKTRHRDKR